MPVVITYLETERGQRIGTWDLIRKVSAVGQTIDGEKAKELTTVWDKSPDDRLLAAIVNVGLACRWYFDNQIIHGFIDIKTDKDGKDRRYCGEHDILESLINPRDAWQNRKHQSLYAEYKKYLYRIRDLVKACDITIEIGEGE